MDIFLDIPENAPILTTPVSCCLGIVALLVGGIISIKSIKLSNDFSSKFLGPYTDVVRGCFFVAFASTLHITVTIWTMVAITAVSWVVFLVLVARGVEKGTPSKDFLTYNGAAAGVVSLTLTVFTILDILHI